MGDEIKFGYTSDLAVRMKAHGGQLLAIQFGTFDDERAFHKELATHLSHGREWITQHLKCWPKSTTGVELGWDTLAA